jgi:hypothetical protein
MKLMMFAEDRMVIEVEVPKKCPKCGKDFTEPGSLREWDYSDAWAFVEMHKEEDGTLTVRTDRYDWEAGETYLLVELSCAGCSTIVAPTKEHLDQRNARIRNAVAQLLQNNTTVDEEQALELADLIIRVVRQNGVPTFWSAKEEPEVCNSCHSLQPMELKKVSVRED